MNSANIANELLNPAVRPPHKPEALVNLIYAISQH